MSGPRALRVMLAGLTLVMLGAARRGEPLTDAAESAVAVWKPVEQPAAGAPADSRTRERALARHVGRAARPGARAIPALSVAAARAAPRAAQPMGEVPVAAARGAGEGAGEFSQVQAAAAGAAPDAARAMAQREPRAAPGDDPSGARAAAEARGGASAVGAPGQGAASAAPLIYFSAPLARGRIGIGTLHTSIRPAGTLNHSSWRLRRASA